MSWENECSRLRNALQIAINTLERIENVTAFNDFGRTKYTDWEMRVMARDCLLEIKSLLRREEEQTK